MTMAAQAEPMRRAIRFIHPQLLRPSRPRPVPATIAFEVLPTAERLVDVPRPRLWSAWVHLVNGSLLGYRSLLVCYLLLDSLRLFALTTLHITVFAVGEIRDLMLGVWLVLAVTYLHEVNLRGGCRFALATGQLVVEPQVLLDQFLLSACEWQVAQLHPQARFR